MAIVKCLTGHEMATVCDPGCSFQCSKCDGHIGEEILHMSCPQCASEMAAGHAAKQRKANDGAAADIMSPAKGNEDMKQGGREEQEPS
eukprot:11121447-Karenia_brevis.AAC.1